VILRAVWFLTVVFLGQASSAAEVLGHISDETAPPPQASPSNTSSARRIIYRVICAADDPLPDCQQAPLSDDGATETKPASAAQSVQGETAETQESEIAAPNRKVGKASNTVRKAKKSANTKKKAVKKAK
jgi:hypothetical protein